MSITILPDKLEPFRELIHTSTKLIVVDHFGTWCGPCKRIAPQFEELAKNNTNVIFLKVDIEACPSVAEENDIQALPTFVLYKDGVERGRVEGADMSKLTKLINLNK